MNFSRHLARWRWASTTPRPRTRLLLEPLEGRALPSVASLELPPLKAEPDDCVVRPPEPEPPVVEVAPGDGLDAATDDVAQGAGSNGDVSLPVILDRELGLGLGRQGGLWEDWGGRGEKWVQGADLEWYFLTPEGGLYRWDGSGTAAGLANYLSLRVSEGGLWEDWGGRGEKWLQGADEQWYFLTSDGALYRWDGVDPSESGSELSGELISPDHLPYSLGPAYYAFPELLVTARDTGLLAGKLGLSLGEGGLWEDWGGRGEKWLQGADEQWYFLTSDGALYRWDGVDPNESGSELSGELVATLSQGYYSHPELLCTPWQVHGELVAELGPAYHSHPELLYNAAAANSLSQELGLHVGEGGLWEDWGGRGEKWLRGADEQWYFLLPEGALYRWDGNGPLTGVVGELGLHVGEGGLWEDWGGRGEKWLRGADEQWYFLTSDGALYRWDGVDPSESGSELSGELVAEPGPVYHAFPELLYTPWQLQGQLVADLGPAYYALPEVLTVTPGLGPDDAA